MLIITRGVSQSMQRRKYMPVANHTQWFVRDSGLGRVVFGPSSRVACEKYIKLADGGA
jgi:hypothetical protein